MNNQGEKIIKELEEAYNFFSKEMERIKKEHREKINDILREIDERKMNQLKDEFK